MIPHSVAYYVLVKGESSSHFNLYFFAQTFLTCALWQLVRGPSLVPLAGHCEGVHGTEGRVFGVPEGPVGTAAVDDAGVEGQADPVPHTMAAHRTRRRFGTVDG